MGWANFDLCVVAVAGWYLFYTYVRLSCHLQPRSRPLTHRKKVEWDNRAVSTVHAAITTFGALVCLAESVVYTPEQCFFGFSWYPYVFVNIFLGYLWYDLLITVYYFAVLRDIGTVVHHLLFIAVSLYVVYNEFFKYPYAWLSVAEASTPFVNFRWFLAETGRKDSGMYMVNGLLLLATFFVFRIVAYSSGLWHLWVNRELFAGFVWLQVTALGLLLSHCLNIYWFRKILMGALKVLSKPKAK